MKILGIVLLTAGLLGLVYKGFTYSRPRSKDLGLFKVNYSTNESVDIPMWGGVIMTVAGATLLVLGMRKP